MLFPNEKKDVQEVIEIADQIGYGNLISHLRRAWARLLMRGNPRLDYETAVKFTNADAYPEDFDLLDKNK